VRLAHDPPVRGRGTIDYAAWGGATATADTRELGGQRRLSPTRRAFEVALVAGRDEALRSLRRRLTGAARSGDLVDLGEFVRGVAGAEVLPPAT
jgi:hypothetical protein